MGHTIFSLSSDLLLAPFFIYYYCNRQSNLKTGVVACIWAGWRAAFISSAWGNLSRAVATNKGKCSTCHLKNTTNSWARYGRSGMAQKGKGRCPAVVDRSRDSFGRQSLEG
jgi:hypothetical protein